MAGYIVVCTDRNGGIGIQNRLPWSIKSEMAWFSKLTKNAPIIVGRKTWDSILEHSPQGLHGRDVYVVSGRGVTAQYATMCRSLLEAVKTVEARHRKDYYIIGGGSIYKEAMSLKIARGIIRTVIDADYYCDTRFEVDESNYVETANPDYDDEWSDKNRLDGVEVKMSLKYYERRRSDVVERNQTYIVKMATIVSGKASQVEYRVNLPVLPAGKDDSTRSEQYIPSAMMLYTGLRALHFTRNGRRLMHVDGEFLPEINPAQATFRVILTKLGPADIDPLSLGEPVTWSVIV